MHSPHRNRSEAGASAVEYGLLAVLVAAVIVIAVAAFGGLTSELFSSSCEEARSKASLSATCS